VRTQLSVVARQDLVVSEIFVTFATAKGSRIKVNSKLIVNNKTKVNMEIIYNTIQTTLNSFDFAYCIIVNVLTYLIINIINSRNGNIDMKMWSKRIILIICIIVVGGFYYFNGSDIKLVLNSAIITPVFWSWIMKPICRHFKIDYKQLNLFE
jgi:hypothetical protein